MFALATLQHHDKQQMAVVVWLAFQFMTVAQAPKELPV
jgi:hypothetical protein